MYKNYKRFYRQFRYSRINKNKTHKINIDSSSERFIQVMVLMLFAGVFLVLIYGVKTIATWRVVSWVYIIFAVLFSQMPSRLLPSVFKLRKELKVLLAICALAPFFTGLLLLANFYISVDESVKVVKVTECHFFYSENTIEVELDDDELNKHLEIRKFPLNEYSFNPDSAVYTIKKGIFGFSIVVDSKLK